MEDQNLNWRPLTAEQYVASVPNDTEDIIRRARMLVYMQQPFVRLRTVELAFLLARIEGLKEQLSKLESKPDGRPPGDYLPLETIMKSVKPEWEVKIERLAGNGGKWTVEFTDSTGYLSYGAGEGFELHAAIVRALGSWWASEKLHEKT